MITGANGYIASLLIKKIKDHKIIKYVRGSSLELIRENKVNCIIHTAVNYNKLNESSVHDVLTDNIYIPTSILYEAIKYNCKYFVNISTVYTKMPEFNMYSQTKFLFNEILKFNSNKIKIITITFPPIYGGNQTSGLFYDVKKNNKINLSKDNAINVVHIDNAVNIILKTIKNLDKVESFEVNGVLKNIDDIFDEIGIHDVMYGDKKHPLAIKK